MIWEFGSFPQDDVCVVGEMACWSVEFRQTRCSQLCVFVQSEELSWELLSELGRSFVNARRLAMEL